MTTPEITFAALYSAASDAVKQRLADIVTGAALAQEAQNGIVRRNPQSDSDFPRDRELNPTENGEPNANANTPNKAAITADRLGYAEGKIILDDQNTFADEVTP